MLSQADLSTTGVCDDALQLRLALWFKNDSLMKEKQKHTRKGKTMKHLGLQGLDKKWKLLDGWELSRATTMGSIPPFPTKYK